MFTFGDHVRELTSRFPKCPPAEAEAFTWQAIRDLFNDHPWSFALKEGRLLTEAPYSTGTVAVTNGSTAVTLTGGTWLTSWTTAPSSRRFATSSRNEPYNITITSGTTGTLDVAWQGDTNTATTYSLYRDIYAVPADCDFSKAYFIFDPTRNARLAQKDFGVFVREKMGSAAMSITGTPYWITRVALTATGIPQIQFGPQAPGTAENYVLFYFQMPTKPTSLASGITPGFPQAYEDLIWRRACWQLAAHPRYFSPARESFLRQEFYDRLFEAMSRFDGLNEINRTVPGTSPMLPGDSLDYPAIPRVTYLA